MAFTIKNSINKTVQAIDSIKPYLKATHKKSSKNKEKILKLRYFSKHALLKAYFQDKTHTIINSESLCERLSNDECEKIEIEKEIIIEDIFKEGTQNEKQ